MASITNSSLIQSAAVRLEVSAVGQDRKQPNPAKALTETQATVVSFSAKAIAASTQIQSLPTLDPDKVSNAVSEVSGANGLAFLNAHLDLSLAAARFGDAWAAGIRQGTFDTEYTLASVATSNATNVGVPIQSSIKSADDLKSYAMSGSSAPIISVADFSFKSSGSTYSITNQADGTLLGTKDGQAWHTWQLSAVNGKTNFGSGPKTATSDAATALQTLTSVNDHKTSSKSLAPLDVSA